MQKYKSVPYIHAFINPKLTYQQCLLNFKLLTIQDKTAFTNHEWLEFLNLLKSYISEMNDLAKAKYLI
jgi:hypothetical protein